MGNGCFFLFYFRMRISCLPLPHVLISIRIGNEAGNPYCAVMPNRTNRHALGRRGRFKAVSCFHLRGFEYLIISLLKHARVCGLQVSLLHFETYMLLLVIVKWIDLAERWSRMRCFPCFVLFAAASLCKENQVYVHLAVSPSNF
jgi:hypothetical protein